MTVPLARDQHGNPLDVPAEAAYWRVRRHTGGRPSTVLGPDGEPLFLPIAGDRQELRAYGCNGSIRLEAVDGDYRPVQAPVAFVELGNDDVAPRNVDASPGQSDMVRTSFESMTRTMEAMQRAQVERERALAQKERALTDAQVAMQRSHTELMVALLERATGGKPQDALGLIKEQAAIQKALDDARGDHRYRNAGAEPIAIAAPVADEPQQTVVKWAGMIAPWIPQVGEALAGALAPDDPVKAAVIRRNAGVVAGMMSGVAGVGGQAMASGISMASAMPVAHAVGPQRIVIEHVGDATPRADADDDADVDNDDDDRPVPSRAMRQVLAQLEDDEAASLSRYLDGLDNDAFDAVNEAATSISRVDERLAWARGLTYRIINEDAEDATDDEDGNADDASVEAATVSAPAAGMVSIPPALIPVLAQLSPTEQMLGVQILQSLDTATVERLKAELLALPTDRALARVRRMIASAQQRSASVAQRAAMAALEDEAGDATNGGEK